MNRGLLVTGATGFIGGHVIRAALARGDIVWAWSRNSPRASRKLPAEVRVVETLAEIPATERIDAIVNLAGAPVIGPPWTRARRQLLIDSRVKTTAAVIAWCTTRTQRPAVLISASAIGFYGPAGDNWLDENSPSQPVFQSQLCLAREAAADAAAHLGIRVVNLRIGLVLGADGGIFTRLEIPAKFGLAARIGDGRQWMSWVHIDDVVRIVELAIDDPSLNGPINAVAPAPARQGDFQRELTRALHRPLWMWIPGGVLRLALGEMAELLVQGQRVTPRRLLEAGFVFRHATLAAAIEELVRPARS
ncbi:MAG: TIGR01777 family oxidoreductase [Pseudomonadota bacterium]